VILIHHGSLLYDGALGGLVERLAPFKLIRLTINPENSNGAVDRALTDEIDVLEREAGRLVLRTARSATPAITARLLSTLPVLDLAVEDPPIEAVIDQIYQEGNV
jgi:ABC-2 type transport system ATP-binding protein